MEYYLRKQIAIAACIFFGQISIGYLAFVTPVIVKLQDPEQTVLVHIISDTETSLLGSISLLGILIGSNISGWLCNTVGRKPCLLLGGIIAMTTFLMLTSAETLWMVIMGRFLVSLGIGIIFVVNLTYIAEIASTNIRGIFLTLTELFTAVGILVAFSVGPYVSYVGIMYCGFFLALGFCIACLFIPETPAYYVLKAKEIEAKSTLVFLGRSADVEEVLSFKPNRQKSKLQEWRNIFSTKSNRKAFIISLVLFLCQQMSGYIPVILFSTLILQSVDSSIDPNLATIIVGVMLLLASSLSALFVERVGRKILMLVSSAVCSGSLMMLGGFFVLDNAGYELTKSMPWIPLLTIITFITSYQLGLGIIPGVFMSETFDSAARGPGSSLIITISMLVSFLNTISFGYVTSALGSHVVFFINAAACAMAFGITCVFVFETKGKSLAEVQCLLNN